METPKPQEGTWTLTAPDGRTWQAESPIRCVSLEQRERVPADVAMQRILAAADETCDWREEDPDGPMPGTYESACGEAWSFIEGGVKENGVHFCQNCGKPVNVIPFPVDQPA